MSHYHSNARAYWLCGDPDCPSGNAGDLAAELDDGREMAGFVRGQRCECCGRKMLFDLSGTFAQRGDEVRLLDDRVCGICLRDDGFQPVASP